MNHTPLTLQQAIPTIRMHCDHSIFTCLMEVKRSPRIMIPSKTPFEPGHRILRIQTPLHYCEHHRGDFLAPSYLTAAQKRRIETTLKDIRPKDFKPDFDGAFVELVLVTTPEYRRYLKYIGEVAKHERAHAA